MSFVPQRLLKILPNQQQLPQNQCHKVKLFLNGIQKIQVLVDQKFPYMDGKVVYTVNHLSQARQIEIKHSDIKNNKVYIQEQLIDIDKFQLELLKSHQLGFFAGLQLNIDHPIISPMLIQKAIAKSFGSYNEIIGGHQKEIFEVLTSMPCQIINLQSIKKIREINLRNQKLNQIWQLMNQAVQKQYPVIFSKEITKHLDNKEYPDRQCHILIATSGEQLGDYRILKLLNFRNLIFKGKLWDQQQKLPDKVQNFLDQDQQDRQYFFPFQKIIQGSLYENITICYYDQQLKQAALCVEMKEQNFSVVAEFEVENNIQSKIYFSLSTQLRQHRQYKENKSIKIKCYNFMLCKQDDQGKIQLIKKIKSECNQGSFFYLQSLKRGKYYLIGQSKEYQKYLILKVHSRNQTLKLNLVNQTKQIEFIVQSIFKRAASQMKIQENNHQAIGQIQLTDYFFHYRAVYWRLLQDQKRFENQCKFNLQVKFFKSVNQFWKRDQQTLQFKLGQSQKQILIAYYGNNNLHADHNTYQWDYIEIQKIKDIKQHTENGQAYVEKADFGIKRYQNSYGTFFFYWTKSKTKYICVKICAQQEQDFQNFLITDSKGNNLQFKQYDQNNLKCKEIQFNTKSDKASIHKQFLFIRKKREKYFQNVSPYKIIVAQRSKK